MYIVSINGKIAVVLICLFRVFEQIYPCCPRTFGTALVSNNNKRFKSFKSKENIHKKDVGPYHGFGYLSLISDPINLAKGARGKNCEFANFNNGSRLKD